MDAYILHRIDFDCHDEVQSMDCFAFYSWWAANRAMYDSWIEEYDKRPDAPKDGELYDKEKHDPDGFWEAQPAPFESDWSSEIRFHDGRRIAWKILKRRINDLSYAWCDRPGYEPENPEESQRRENDYGKPVQ